MIATAAQLAEFLPLIERNPRIAADTEADSLHCYREKLCLLQISLPEGDFVVDPLSGNDLAPLTRALAGKELVLHGADYDLRLLRRDLNFLPHRLFDTALAARLLGVREFSYAALVQRYFGVELPKGSQKANWALRPLSKQMEAYARNDTHYLLPLAAKLEAELTRHERIEWLRQSCERALAAAAFERERNGAEAWRIRGAGLVRGREAAVLRALWVWRDEEARRADRPAFHILRNDQLLEAAHQVVEGSAPHFRHLSERRARGFREAWSKAMALPESEWPRFERHRRERPTREMQLAAENLRKRRDAAANHLAIDPAFIAPRAALDAIAAATERADDLLAQWQRELIGV